VKTKGTRGRSKRKEEEKVKIIGDMSEGDKRTQSNQGKGGEQTQWNAVLPESCRTCRCFCIKQHSIVYTKEMLKMSRD